MVMLTYWVNHATARMARLWWHMAALQLLGIAGYCAPCMDAPVSRAHKLSRDTHPNLASKQTIWQSNQEHQ
jgi:hypothetical protein